MEIKINSLDSIREAARQFIDGIGQHRVFAFYGSMGAGKTTFVKAICEELGVDDVITSPTFAIINEYALDSDLLPDVSSVYHFDFYRIKKLEEVFYRVARTDRRTAARRCRQGQHQRKPRRFENRRGSIKKER